MSQQYFKMLSTLKAIFMRNEQNYQVCKKFADKLQKYADKLCMSMSYKTRYKSANIT